MSDSGSTPGNRNSSGQEWLAAEALLLPTGAVRVYFDGTLDVLDAAIVVAFAS
jgi:hypothetical protein